MKPSEAFYPEYCNEENPHRGCKKCYGNDPDGDPMRAIKCIWKWMDKYTVLKVKGGKKHG